MAGTEINIGLACFSGAYAMACFANLYFLISLAKARRQAEARKEAQQDHFYDNRQEVVDLTCLMCLDIENAKKALLDDKFKTPISEKIAEVLAQTDEPDWQKICLARKTRKASYDDLMMIQASLRDKKLPYLTVVRKNPVRVKTCRNFSTDIRPIDEVRCGRVLQGRPHEDLRRHQLSQLGSGLVRSS